MTTSNPRRAERSNAKSRLWLAAGIMAVATTCRAPDREPPPSGEPGQVTGELGGGILVSAAASLTDAFDDLATAFEASHRGVDVVLNLAGSSALREQILDGAPVDVFASADHANMDRVVESGAVSGGPWIFARNRLQIAVPRGNPSGVTGLSDLADSGRLIGLCAAAVPCGDFARRSLAKAGVTAALDTDEPDVRALLTKIELGELDAGITYVTDVLSAEGRVAGIEIPESENVVIDYPIARLAAAPNAEAASAFISFVRSEEGRVILERLGFVAP